MFGLFQATVGWVTCVKRVAAPDWTEHVTPTARVTRPWGCAPVTLGGRETTVPRLRVLLMPGGRSAQVNTDIQWLGYTVSVQFLCMSDSLYVNLCHYFRTLTDWDFIHSANNSLSLNTKVNDLKKASNCILYCRKKVDYGFQRSRSQCSDYLKWFMVHNCFPFKPYEIL